MIDWRYATIVDQITLTDNDTDNIDLPSEGIISKMEIEIKNTNAATISDVHRRRLAEHITNLSLTGDTNDIIFDMNAMQARGFAMDTEGKIPPELCRCYDSAVQKTVIPIYFGRGPRDEEYGLNLAGWTNVKMTLTNDFTTDWFAANGGSVIVRALWTFDSEIHPERYLAKATVDEAAVKTANMWSRPVILPVRYPIRRIATEGYIPTLNTGTDVGNPKATLATSIEDIKFTKMARKDMIWHDSFRQLFRFNTDEYGHELLESYMDHGDAANALWTDTALGRCELANMAIAGAAPTLVNDWPQPTLNFERHMSMTQWPNTAATHAAIMAAGRGYNSMGFFRFYTWTPNELLGDLMEDWLNPGPDGDGVCELTYQIGDTDVKARTHIEQAVPHPET